VTRRALVVDDADDVRLLVREVCRRVGVEVDEAPSGSAALAHLATGPLPDVVVLDVQMPELDGWATLAAIRKDPRTREVPVILCSVRSRPADLERARALGASQVVPKPFAIEELAQVVQQVIGGAA
jgi:CheY-like chemotaxis protein